MLSGRVGRVVFTIINMVLAMYAGAAFATLARLRWDPSAYLPLRLLFPVEHRVAMAILCTGAITLMVLGYLAVTVELVSRTAARRVLYIVYAGTMAVLMLVEVIWLSWMASRINDVLNSRETEMLVMLMTIADKLLSMLDILQELHLMPQGLDPFKEIKADIPKNLYVVIWAAALLALLQVAACGLAVLFARRAWRTLGTAEPKHVQHETFKRTQPKTALKNRVDLLKQMFEAPRTHRPK